MGILDEAIREHLELKRQHGADDSELKQLEDEAFGPPERPDATAVSPEAPTEFMAQPEGVGEGEQAPPFGVVEEPSAEGRKVDEGAAGEAQAPRTRREPVPEIAGIQEPPEASVEPEAGAELEQQAEGGQQATAEPERQAAHEAEPHTEEVELEERTEDQPALEHEAVSEPAEQAGPSTEERRMMADQPTEHYDVERELAEEEPAPSAEKHPGEEDEDEFFDEQRLSDELDQALDAPQEHEEKAEHEEAAAHDEAVAHDEAAAHEGEDEHEELEEEDEYDEELPRGSEEDLLDETPDFLEDSGDDQLWFEQKPPKDFDFDD